MRTFELTWSMYGTAEIQADSEEEAVRLANSELIGWGGFGTDFEDVSVDGCESEVEG